MYHAHIVRCVAKDSRRDRQQPSSADLSTRSRRGSSERYAPPSSSRVELVDLQEIDLPFLDEPIMAARGRYEHEHTVRWSELVRSYDGFVFVFPQYNWGYPAVLKNALDFLYHEWADKPAGLVTYGSRGGGLAATQLRQVLQGLHMRSTETNIELKTDETMLTRRRQLPRHRRCVRRPPLPGHRACQRTQPPGERP